MSVVKKILGTKINHEIVNLIKQSGGDAISFNHIKHKIIKASQHAGKDKNNLGLVGKVDRILVSELKKTIFFITHDLDESLKLGDHIGILNHGKLVQVGTPIDIIMKPADDYVEAFVKDVNRAKVIKAKIIMTPANSSDGVDKSNLVKVNEDQFIDEFLPKVVCSNSNCEIVDKEGNVKGYITEKELSKALTKEHMADAVKSSK